MQFRSLVKSRAFVHLSDEVRARNVFKGAFVLFFLIFSEETCVVVPCYATAQQQLSDENLKSDNEE